MAKYKELHLWSRCLTVACVRVLATAAGTGLLAEKLLERPMRGRENGDIRHFLAISRGEQRGHSSFFWQYPASFAELRGMKKNEECPTAVPRNKGCPG